MAKRRTSCIKIKTDEIQGEGSWVIVRRLSIKETRAFRDKMSEAGDEYNAFEAGVAVMKQNVVEWNWVDDDGNPLPNPKDDPEVIELLTDDEVAVLGKAIRGDEDELKN